MASTNFIKDTGFTGMLSLLLLGILLPSVFSVTSMPPNTTDGMNGTTILISPMSMIYCPSFMCNYTDCYMMHASQNATSCIAWSFCQLMRQTDMSYVAGCVASCAESCVDASQTNCSVNCCNSTGCLNATFASMMMIMTTTDGPTAMTQTSTTMATSMDYTSQPPISNDMTGTTMPYTTMSMIYCPSFMCNYTDCYMMYDSQNATSCALGCCQLMRQTDMSYVASCVGSCAESCVNASQTNCSVNCCNSTGCLNATFASMMMTTTTDMVRTTTVETTTTTTTTPTTTMMASIPPPTADNGKKCHQGTCMGSTCYTDFGQAALQTCSSAQPHCQLKKEMVSSDMKWTAGCTANCSAEAPCKQSTTPPCHLECCNATMTSSCLRLNGTLNVPNFATRGPHLNTELSASLLCLLAIALLL
ncbi:uncharacterized protein LOC115567619 isoform X1 [Sparus aurata]|uniref:uncharacterized protein LOC115567619 isoform X1 n=1 Tax=Sparus aurata TaxID=8175 RepID=UPI0011C15FE7|nr:uncharacterized protein LOC115567619 isoform X1 [Sparus aurata]